MYVKGEAETGGMMLQAKDYWGLSEAERGQGGSFSYRSKREHGLVATSILNFQPPELEIYCEVFCCSKPPLCGSLSQKPQETNAAYVPRTQDYCFQAPFSLDPNLSSEHSSAQLAFRESCWPSPGETSASVYELRARSFHAFLRPYLPPLLSLPLGNKQENVEAHNLL